MPWTELEIKSWRHFQEFASGYNELTTPLVTPYVFRGQARSSWTLRPSLLRHLAAETGSDEAREVERMLLNAFQSQSHLYWGAEGPTSTSQAWQWWALMQHYGVPTRLLDWTASPYVGLYFAVEADWDEPGALFVMHPSSLLRDVPAPLEQHAQVLESAIWDSESTPCVYPFSAAKLSHRMAAQQGHFTFSTDPCGDQHELIPTTCMKPPYDEDNAIKCTIRAEDKPKFLLQLRAMNVTGQSLFPGADGFGRSMRESVDLHRFMDEEDRQMFLSLQRAVADINAGRSRGP